MREQKIRSVAICVCRDGDHILVAEYHDIKKGQTFYRPLGGTIEFGEHGEEAVRREFLEEIDSDLTDLHFVGMLENIYTYEGERGHEIVLVYEGRLTNLSINEKESLKGDELGEPFKVVWKRLDEFGPGNTPVYPDGLFDFIAK